MSDKTFMRAFLSRIAKNKKTRLGIVIFAVGYSLAFIGISLKDKVKYIDTTELVFSIVPFATAIVGLGYFLLGYLEGNKSEYIEKGSDNGSDNNDLRKEFRRYFEELRHTQERNRIENRETFELITEQISHRNELQLDEKQRKEIFNSLQQSFNDNINADFYKQLNENLSIELTQEKRSRLDLILNDFDRIKRRLGTEIDTLSRKANLNLVIGSLTTLAALVALWLFVFQNNLEFKGYSDMLYHYIPRLSLIVFIEVFAYFFLKLYKINLNDIKYFQNELTTVELKLSSLTTAINFGKDTDISAITIELSKTERNFILKKGETTVDLEKSKIENTNLKEMLNSVIGLVNKKK